MKLNDVQIDFIKEDLVRKGVRLDELAESLADHICCWIEQCDHKDFELAYEAALAEFGSFGPREIQERTTFLLTLKREITMKKTMYILGYFAAILVTTGTLFKLMHWPGANVMLVLGIALLNLGYLPAFFYSKYKQSLAS